MLGIKPAPADGTEANRHLVEAAYRAFGARDVETLVRLLSPMVVWGEPDNPLIPSAGTRRGIQGVLDWLNVGKATELILELEPERFLADADMVAVVGHTKVLARPTGKVYATDFVHVVTVADGKIVRFQEYFDTFGAAEAFRA
jgi:ketosteroid isomerase-like protein